jgi:AcrR family transcriptional regulator
MSRRKAQTAREIAQVAARLFAAQGVSGVTAAEIAASAGVSLRTFYRYFATKEDAVAPILEIGAARWQSAFADAKGDLASAIPGIIAAQLSPSSHEDREALAGMRPLLRALDEDRELRTVWDRVNHESELRLTELVRERGVDRFDARLLAAAATGSIRIGLEEWAAGDASLEGDGSPASLAVRAFGALSPVITSP